MNDLQRLGKFLDVLKADVYPEIPSEPHLSITRQMVERLMTKKGIVAGQWVLDIGCGQGWPCAISLPSV